MALELHEEEEVGLGHHTLCEFIDVGARKWIHTERLRVIPTELGRMDPSFHIATMATSKIAGGLNPAKKVQEIGTKSNLEFWHLPMLNFMLSSKITYFCVGGFRKALEAFQNCEIIFFPSLRQAQWRLWPAWAPGIFVRQPSGLALREKKIR